MPVAPTLPPVAPTLLDVRRPAASAEPLRRKRSPPPPRLRGISRRAIISFLVFIMVVLIADALIGDRGLVETMHARRRYREAAAALDAIRRDNARLREEIRKLNEDPATIEGLARKELGLIRPGELVFIVKDSAPAR